MAPRDDRPRNSPASLSITRDTLNVNVDSLEPFSYELQKQEQDDMIAMKKKCEMWISNPKYPPSTVYREQGKKDNSSVKQLLTTVSKMESSKFNLPVPYAKEGQSAWGNFSALNKLLRLNAGSDADDIQRLGNLVEAGTGILEKNGATFRSRLSASELLRGPFSETKTDDQYHPNSLFNPATRGPYGPTEADVSSCKQWLWTIRWDILIREGDGESALAALAVGDAYEYASVV